MEAMNLVEVVLNHGHEEETDESAAMTDATKSSPIKGLDESVTITVTRTPGRPGNTERLTGKPANFALLSSPARNGKNSDVTCSSPREEMTCNVCERVFKYRAAFQRHEAQCGLPIALKIERAAIIEAKKMEKAVLFEKRKLEEKQERLPNKDTPKLSCQTCLKQFSDEDTYKSHNFAACAAERATYTFACSVCKARFKYKNHMRRHEDSHNNVRRYNCEVCTTAFLRPDHLKRHMMRMHGIVHLPSQSAPEKLTLKPSPGPPAVHTSDEKSSIVTTKNVPMQCPMCNKILSRRDHLLRHMRNVHHINNDSRKRSRNSDPILQGFGGGVMDLFGDTSHNVHNDDDEEEGSENQSMESQDGLLIDESYESVKRENDSPAPETHAESEENTTSHDSFVNGAHQLNEPTETPLNYSYNQFQNDLNVKVQAHLAENQMLTSPFSNGVPKTKVASQIAANNAPNVRSNAEVKSRYFNNSDSNQSVLSNNTRNSGHDWISDLANFNGW
ncbi:hypothetical protein FOCC_FOCC001994 [Frankliniella occidentalis]|uniref:Zinc finger protein 366 isoform X1 n=2 Tax=Frankliniella occidentalis TaxID=133901 RepID=A0A6J1TDW3_FRAOC|nr:zinc finger protein 366 isoform X1 [Frankliniella occidentalis]XP_026289906.1 zinc finger protein 366 isoform X1 [Frankliniella occidentalis]XP_052133675.1 zinc finger protein 366 isoform X1 [Frankliniella occidentalis]KAE8751419.1 hypothetical protein FOCC_FOCC001994 [Frankliniella occidentalis]